jgi:hypothetical protein
VRTTKVVPSTLRPTIGVDAIEAPGAQLRCFRLRFPPKWNAIHVNTHTRCKQRGTADQAPFDHATGVGHVAGHAGHYADALAKGRQVVLIVTETTGAVHPDAVGMLYAWHAETRAEGCIDRTVYGTSRTATTSFFTHHLRLISLAAVIGAALPVAIWAKSRKSHLLSGAPLAGLLPVVM